MSCEYNHSGMKKRLKFGQPEVKLGVIAGTLRNTAPAKESAA